MGESRRWRVHVDYWDGYVNFYVGTLEAAEKLRERMLQKHYAMEVYVSEDHGSGGLSSEKFLSEIL